MIVPMAIHHNPLTSPELPGSGGVTMERLRTLRPQIMEIAKEHGASNLHVFGSMARGEADDTSDVDFLVTMAPGRSLLDLSGLEVDLQDLLGCDVNAATAVQELMREEIEADAVPL
jgi:predicted nucleotidyltransferase